ncbi:3-keto-disaccharide hydrolase [Pelagicoccus mobilis]|uniref:DUF1080 domain-containing protein n=1 Tax=Pelagicoccus mobilis TaxID=415221 RepID=A0A934RUD9_9BACT|nr:DUF1080 domain-containing protein [Pelagicoccus mobilis]MBK1877037.1 DUF1080 domain-containing protein [Pelagicoccus mobilis]
MLPRNCRIALLALAGLFVSAPFVLSKDWVSLFDGESLEGWTPNENPDSWVVEEGCIVTKGDRSHLFYSGKVSDHSFKNFIFEAEVKTTPGANSGIYIHTEFQDEGWPSKGYECQVNNSNPVPQGKYVEHKMTGSIYAIRNNWQAPVRDDVWFKYRIRVAGKTIQTFINGRLICEYTERDNPWRPENMKERVLDSGTFAIQAHDPGSVVRYRNIRVKILPDVLPSSGSAESDEELDRLITSLSAKNQPLIDIGIKSPSLSFAVAQAKASRRLGFTIMEPGLEGAPANLLVVNDREKAPEVATLKAAKAAGMKIVFSSGGVAHLEEKRVKARLQAIADAELGWADFWVPGK